VSGGHHDNVFKVSSLADGKVLQTVHHHRAPVVSLALSEDGNRLACGSADATASLWSTAATPGSWKENNPSSLFFAGGSRSRARLSAVVRGVAGVDASISSASPLCILHGHHGPVTTIALSGCLGVALSGSRASGVLVFELNSGRFVRSLRTPRESPESEVIPCAVGIAHASASLIVHFTTRRKGCGLGKESVFLSYSLNGDVLSSCKVRGALLKPVCITHDGMQVLVISARQIEWRRIDDLGCAQTIELSEEDRITAAVCSPDDMCCIAALESGELMVAIRPGKH